MKTKIVILSAAMAACHLTGAAAIAQSSSTQSTQVAALGDLPAAGATAPASATTAAPAASAQSVATAPEFKPRVKMGYLGIMFGPGLGNDVSGKTKDGDDLFLNNRPQLGYALSENVDIGLQARFNLHFRDAGKMEVTQDAWRAFALIKNLYKRDIFSVTLLPRIYMPTRSSHRGQTMLGGIELLPILGISPKDSRFSFSVYPQAIQFFYRDNNIARNTGANDFYIVGNFEGTYQTSGSTAITFGFYPEYISGKTRALRNTSNELDIGFNWDFAKGWSVNPFVASEFIGMGSNGGSAFRNMGFNVLLNGTFL